MKKTYKIVALTLILILYLSCDDKKSDKHLNNHKNTYQLEDSDIRIAGIKGKKIFTNRLGDTLYNGEEFYAAKGFKNTYCIVSKMIDGYIKYGVINLKGEKIIPINLDEEILFYDNNSYFQIKDKDNGYGWIDRTGKVIVAPIYKEARKINEQQLIVQNKKLKWGIIDVNNKKIIDLKYNWIGHWHSNLAVINKGKKWGFINKEGKIKIPLIYSFAKDFEKGVALCKKNNKYGIIDSLGNNISDFVFDDYKNIVDVYGDEYMDKWKKNTRFSMVEGYIVVKKNGKWGYINRKGVTIIPFEFDLIGIPPKGQYKVGITKNKRKGMYNIKEKTIEWNK